MAFTFKFLHFTLNRNRFFAGIIVSVLLTIMLVMAITSMRGDSGTTDEVAHIPAGYSYLVKHDFRINPEHPPLIKALSAIPLLFLNLSKPFDDWSWEAANQWELGWNFLYERGNNANQVLFWSRIPIIALMLILGFLIYQWGKKMFGVSAAILALALFVFDPNIIAHGRLVTTDIGMALFWTLALYGFWLFTKNQSWKNTILAGIALGLAFLAKFSAILLIPTFLILIAAKFIIDKRIDKIILVKTLYVFLISIAIIWVGYFPFTIATPLDIQTNLINASLPGEQAETLRNILINLSRFAILRPFAHYLLGLFMVFAHALGGHTAFLLGEFSRTGWWYYFPIVFLTKTTVPVLILIILTAVTLITKTMKKIKDGKEDFLINNLILLIPIAIYFAASMKSSLNLGIRHLLPIFPLFYLWIGQIVNIAIFQKKNAGRIILILLILWHISSSLAVYPYYIAYFNDFVLDKNKAYQYITDSSLDWGQDLKRLAQFVQKNNISEIKVDYFGGGVPNYYIPQAQEWHAANGPTTGWLAISATYFQSSRYWSKIENTHSYEWLDEYEPVKIIGRSILVYNIKE